ncbi:nitrous oxide reductase accessory protein NosL [Maritalea mediterranea]|uniref:Nitrous oxide reductase accessory protein NosL n=1 Tax=Maritalea mediterranea TaxID=2909667 RepID=A0ABS9E6F3_9HYPH|nr:nitrous oxide reductase accessory protein NosL [Maritalea mediterranea]MCF4098436.1 nitrous oxide reductase accessory protein NosL [Maritalea mediterranea]
MMFARSSLALLTALVLTGCASEASTPDAPDPITLTAEAAGHYCQMTILEHDGPKAQMYLAGYEHPLWFSQVRDGLAYIKSPEQEAKILVTYVNDMSKAKNWSEPGVDNWIRADEAYFVVHSDAIGGMGAPELVPFSSEADAIAFAKNRGGMVKRLGDISAETVLAPVDAHEGDHQ